MATPPIGHKKGRVATALLNILLYGLSLNLLVFLEILGRKTHALHA
ncbi:MAG: hypothetical protein H6R04_11 [Burkholderiaceae bacterium]|nr:hypothetical protein [Burkholderiaceae bacterium]